MVKRVLVGLYIFSTIFLYAKLNFGSLPFGLGSDGEELNSLPLAVDTDSKIVSVDDLPVDESDTQSDYEPYLDDIALEDRLKGDIDGDGKDDFVAWKEFASDNKGHYYQLLVIGSDGTLIWQGPKDKSIDNYTVFGSWDIGVSLPQALIDIDGDCKAEILAPAPTSDVSPQYFRILKYDNGMVVALKPKILMASKSSNKKFIWVGDYKGDGLNRGWVMNLYPANSIDRAKADIVYTDSRGNATFKKAILEFNLNGATVKKWLKADEPEVETDSLSMPSTPSNSSNQTKKVKSSSYIAYISNRDHKDMLGSRIKSIRGLLIRDRENFYSGAKDPQDTGASIFKSKESREDIKRMKIVIDNTSYDKLKESILYGNGLIKVTKDNGGLRIKLLK